MTLTTIISAFVEIRIIIALYIYKKASNYGWINNKSTTYSNINSEYGHSVLTPCGQFKKYINIIILTHIKTSICS